MVIMEYSKYLNRIDEVSDDKNPKYMFQTMDSSLVLKVALGKIDAKKYAAMEMVNKGLDKKGKWVGHPESKKIWKV